MRKLLRYSLALSAALAFSPAARAQTTGGVGIGTATPAASALLDLTSSTQGLLAPRMTATERTAIGSPAAGLLVYQTDGVQPGFWYHTGAAWTYVNPAPAGDNLGNHAATQALVLNEQPVLLRGSADQNHQLRYNGGIDGPQLMGYSGGELGYNPGSGFQSVLHWSSTGNVGIGTTTPGARLEVKGDILANDLGANGSLYLDMNATNSGAFYQQRGLKFGAPGTGEGLASARVAGSPNRYGLDFYTGYANRMAIANNGNVGIGTSSPQARLDVPTGAVRLPGGGGGDSWFNYFGDNKNYLRGTTVLADAGGSVGIGTASPGAMLDVSGTVRLRALATPGVVLTDASGNLSSQAASALADNLGNHTATQNLNLGTYQLVGNGGSNGLAVLSNGNVGIGTAAPAGRLDVNGQTRTSTAYVAGVLQGSGNNLGGAVGIGIRTDGGLNIGQGNPAAGVDRWNVSVGFESSNMTLGSWNTSFGYNAGRGNRGRQNVFIGPQTGFNNDGDTNVLIGFQAGYNNAAGSKNTFLGNFAGAFNESGSSNLFLGNFTGDANTTGSFNTYVGDNSGRVGTAGSRNTVLGYAAYTSVDNLTNATALGAGAVVSQSNSLVLGNGASVGIGTSSPQATLDVVGNTRVSGALSFGTTTRQMLNLWGTNYGIGVQNNTEYFRSDHGFAWYIGGSHSDGQFDSGGGYPAMVLEGSRLGIGNISPSFPLDVQSTDITGNSNYGYLNGSGQTGYATNNSGPVSIRATGRVLASEFNATSDRRLKNVIGRSNNAADLTLLNKLRITDYTMRDRVQYGPRQFKKVIAQEVEQVFPQAVNQHAGFLPDVYVNAVKAELQADSLLVLTLPAASATAANAGQRLKLIAKTGEVVGTVQAARGNTLVVRGARQLAGQDVFVFGLEHADVRTVDYEALSMLNVSATQELARKVRELEPLREQVAALQAELAASKAQATRQVQQVQAQAATQSASLDQRLKALENLLGTRAEVR